MSRFLPLKRPVLPERFSPALLVRTSAWFIAALIVGWVVSGWFWRIVAPDAGPRAETASMPDIQSAARAIVSRHLFGRTSLPGDETDESNGRVNLNLLGAMTSTPESVGFAILAEEGKPSMAVIEGETFLPGITLVQILPGKVRVKMGEQEELIEMTKQPSMQQAMPETDPVATQAGTTDLGGPARRNATPRPERPRP